ncbi:hypothetical protein CFBP6109_P100134 (plasmid) [Pseudomonas syringae pv. cerasicola]|nr:hypothetical protein CFBP6109_P100134 [Pseudomonas syringae pv. cerasicola]
MTQTKGSPRNPGRFSIQYGLVSVAPPCECPERIAPVHAQPI